MSRSEPSLPLTPTVFYILHALFSKERHGYNIMEQAKAGLGGAAKMGPGTLCGSLDRMIEAGLVARGNTQNPRRIYYRLTALGQPTVRAETKGLSRLALVARRQLGSA
jgi:DNA-binding PadR family transcriptional regulator